VPAERGCTVVGSLNDIADHPAKVVPFVSHIHSFHGFAGDAVIKVNAFRADKTAASA
jgi:hypothetical protein